MTVGEQIKKFRLSQNPKMTQSELAEKSGISRVSIGNYERGDRTPDINAINAIANALNVPVGELLGDDSENRKALVFDSKKISDMIFEIYNRENSVKDNLMEKALRAMEPFNNNLSKSIKQFKNDFPNYDSDSCMLFIEYIEKVFPGKVYKLELYDLLKLQEEANSFIEFRLNKIIDDTKDNTKEGDPDSTPTKD